MRMLDRYILAELFRFGGMGFFVFTFLLLTNAILRMLERLATRGVPVSSILELTGLSLPYITVLTIPMSVLVGVLLTFGRLSSDSEITAMRACGVGLGGLVRPVLIYAIANGLLCSYIFVEILPRSNFLLQNLRFEIMQSKINIGIEPRTFTDDFNHFVLYVDDIDQKTSTLHKVFLASEKPGEPKQIYFAQRGWILADESKQVLTIRLQNGVRHEVPKTMDAYIADQFDRLEKTIDMGFLQQAVSTTKGDREKTITELLETIEARKAEGASPNRHWVEIHKRFSIPFACVVFGLIGVPLGIVTRRGGKSSGFATSLALFLIYWIFLRNGEQLGDEGILPPWLAMWMPNMILGGFGLFLLRRAAREREIAAFRWLGDALFSAREWLVRPGRGRRHRQVYDVPAPPRELGFADRRTASGPPRFRRAFGLFSFPGLLDRYVGRQYLKLLTYVIVSFLSISAIVVFFEQADDFLKHQTPSPVILRFLGAEMPQYLFYALPLGVLVGTMLCLSLLSRSSELTAIMACGISLPRAVLPVLLTGLLLSGGGFALNEYVLPHTNAEAERILSEEVKHVKLHGAFRGNRQWLRGKGGEILYYRVFDEAKTVMHGFTVFQLYDTGLPRRRIDAENVAYAGGGWGYEQGRVLDFAVDGRLTAKTSRSFARAAADLQETPDDFVREHVTSREMDFRQLSDYISSLRERGYSVLRYETDLHAKLALPLVSLVMAILGVPFAARWSRSGVLSGVGLSLGLGVIYMILFHVGISLGHAGRLPAAVAAWLPNATFGAVGLLLMGRLRT
ncbi:MAG: LPS export ABC transporter permease LptF [Candidatus Schekmanbacteria bacterium]|nr:LPS export ABC transporter permease LptF [Candidatus Schekmanbacteria bacterium]